MKRCMTHISQEECLCVLNAYVLSIYGKELLEFGENTVVGSFFLWQIDPFYFTKYIDDVGNFGVQHCRWIFCI